MACVGRQREYHWRGIRYVTVIREKRNGGTETGQGKHDDIMMRLRRFLLFFILYLSVMQLKCYCNLRGVDTLVETDRGGPSSGFCCVLNTVLMTINSIVPKDAPKHRHKKKQIEPIKKNQFAARCYIVTAALISLAHCK